MIIRAELKCKQTGCEADPCAVDKVIELPSPRFRLFSRALLADYDFIAENKNAIRHDEDARHCLLILDADGTDGFLVDPQGYNYARYSAFVPNARSLLTLDMGIDRSYLSPAEPWRDESRDEMLRMTLRVDGKPDYTLVLPADEEYLDAVKAYLDIDVFADAMLRLVFPGGADALVSDPQAVRRVRLTFRDSVTTGTPLVARLASEEGILCTVISASTQKLSEEVYGSMLLGIPSGQFQRAMDYIGTMSNIRVEEVDGHVQ